MASPFHVTDILADGDLATQGAGASLAMLMA